jgi:PAS domain S-box-containing protein
MAESFHKSSDDIISAKDYTEKILRSMNDALVVVSTKGDIRVVNTATCIMLGYDEEELVGQPFKKILKPHGQSFVGPWLSNLAAARFIRNIEETYVAKDGREIPVLFAGSLMLDDYGKVLGIVCAAQDITERKYAEEQLRRAKDSLEIKVTERTAELNATNERLQFELSERKKAEGALQSAYTELKNTQVELVQTEKIAALGRFSLGIAHEVRNPLSIILGGLEYLEMKLNAQDERVKDAIAKIKEAIFRADNIVGGLLRFARPSELKTEKIKPEDLINEAIALVKYRAPLGNIAIKTQYCQGNFFVEVDRNQIQQVLFNLVNNAIEALTQGGEITIKCYRSEVSLFSEGKSDCVIEITDTGEGIPKDNMSKVFEPFFTTKRDHRGTGLGLSIARSIVNNHRGEITIESEAGKGTTVKIILPLSA